MGFTPASGAVFDRSAAKAAPHDTQTLTEHRSTAPHAQAAAKHMHRTCAAHAPHTCTAHATPRPAKHRRDRPHRPHTARAIRLPPSHALAGCRPRRCRCLSSARRPLYECDAIPSLPLRAAAAGASRERPQLRGQLPLRRVGAQPHVRAQLEHGAGGVRQRLNVQNDARHR